LLGGTARNTLKMFDNVVSAEENIVPRRICVGFGHNKFILIEKNIVLKRVRIASGDDNFVFVEKNIVPERV
jgi:hypothetical protein